MPHLPSRPLARHAGCAFVLSLALAGFGATPAGAAPSASRHHAAVASAHPTPKKSTRKTASSKSSTKRRHERARRRSEESEPETASLPTLPPIVQLPTADQVLSGGLTPTQAFAAYPVVAAPVPAPSSASDGRPLSAFSASAERLLSAMVDRARSQLGTRYVFGGNSPGQGLDCSSFARFAMEALGIRLPRTAAQQARIGTPVPRDRAMLRPGDLLTFGRGSRVSHVGIYLGEGRFIHASVKSGQIIETTIERNGSLFRRWQGARRLIATGDTGVMHGDS